MIRWLTDNWANVLVTALIAGAVVLAVISIIRDKRKGRSSCGGCCPGCAMAERCHSKKREDPEG